MRRTIFKKMTRDLLKIKGWKPVNWLKKLSNYLYLGKINSLQLSTTENEVFQQAIYETNPPYPTEINIEKSNRPISSKKVSKKTVFFLFKQLLTERQKEPLDESKSITNEKGKVESKKIVSDSVLAQLIRDENMIIRLIEQDILVSVLFKNTRINESENGLTDKLELHLIIFDLLLLDRCSNKDEVIDMYNRYIEDNIKMVLEFPTISIYDIAYNCYFDVKNARKW